MTDIDYTQHCPVCGSTNIEQCDESLFECANLECLFFTSPKHFRATQELRARENRWIYGQPGINETEQEAIDLIAVQEYRWACLKANQKEQS